MEERTSKNIENKIYLAYSTSNNSQNYLHLDDFYQRFYDIYTNKST